MNDREFLHEVIFANNIKLLGKERKNLRGVGEASRLICRKTGRVCAMIMFVAKQEILAAPGLGEALCGYGA